MALTPPSIESLQVFRQEDFTSDETDWAEYVLSQATDAMWVFTGLDTDPTDARAARVLQNAIMELTLWLMSQIDNRDAINSPFTGERIGSYSYQKMQQAQANPVGGSGMFWLDMLFRLIGMTGDALNGLPEGSWASSESVFDQPFHEFNATRAQDPNLFGLI